MNDRTKFIVAALGIFFSYFYFGILQERITRGRYGDQKNEDGTNGEKFTYTLTLVGIQCLWNWIFAKGKPYCHHIDIIVLPLSQSISRFRLGNGKT